MVTRKLKFDKQHLMLPKYMAHVSKYNTWSLWVKVCKAQERLAHIMSRMEKAGAFIALLSSGFSYAGYGFFQPSGCN